jgi:hypothetical protein
MPAPALKNQTNTVERIIPYFSAKRSRLSDKGDRVEIVSHYYKGALGIIIRRGPGRDKIKFDNGGEVWIEWYHYKVIKYANHI